MYESLLNAGLLFLDEEGRVQFREDLQQDFSLHQALSLYLVETIELLDPELGTYPLDLLTLIESVLENPEIILQKQLDVLKTQKMGEMKAAGVEYEERIAELDKMTYPKPNAEFIYGTFNDFAKRHPWVTLENIRPKSIAREMYEGFFSFNDYITEYGLARSEGLLLRYLSDVYRTLTQTVPTSARGELTEELEIYLGALVHATDSSLVDEWERLLDVVVPESLTTAEPDLAPKADHVDITSDERAFTILVRNALFSFLRSLVREDLENAAQLVSGSEPAWNVMRFRTAFNDFWPEHKSIRLDPEARAPKHLRITERNPELWRFEQVICDPEDLNDWALFGTIDIAASRTAGHPVIKLERIGS
jgi:hypothetical protein